MASKFQNRLVGTVILVALGVIILPGLLDGKKKHYEDEFASIPLVPKPGDPHEQDASGSVTQSLPAQPPEGAKEAINAGNPAASTTAPANGADDVDDAPDDSQNASTQAPPAVTTSRQTQSKPVTPPKHTEQKTADAKAADTRAAQNRLAAEQKAAEQKAAQQRLAEQKAAEQKAAKQQRLVEQRIAEQQKIEEQKLKAAQAQSTAQSKPQAEKPQQQEKTQPEKAPAGQAYIVQLGALKNATRATEIVAKLRLSGFRAYTVPSTPVQGEITRVFVGPEANKQKLEASLPELQSQSGLNGGLIRAYNAAH
ncbi:cell division protein DedD [Rouxiella sp. Mn2063]|uniref:cell division protein DedD n=1 Tax=Rouxiella sp. Mn2063 TaxID=3395262 RepID=UPI003BBA15F3